MAKTGRPPIEFDRKQIEIFGYFRATYETMAGYMGCHIDTIRDRMRSDEEFSNAYKKGSAGMKMKLSEAQVQLALKGNATMLVWLGKQYLGQSDTPDNDIDDTDNNLSFEGWT